MDVVVEKFSEDAPGVVCLTIEKVKSGVWYIDAQMDQEDLVTVYSTGAPHGDPRLIIMFFGEGKGGTTIAIDNKAIATGVRGVIEERWGTTLFVVERDQLREREQIEKLVFLENPK